jgi:methyl-accepting chemotaxis protein
MIQGGVTVNDDRITVDEPLISTDVDNLIRTIADRKKVSLKELRQECNISKKNMDKWVAVLEEEGYISVEYGLRGTNIHWKGLDEVSKQYMVEKQYEAEMPPEPEEIPQEEPAEEPVEEPEEKPEEKAEVNDEKPAEESTEEPEEKPEVNEEFTHEAPLEEAEEVDPADVLNEYVERKRDGDPTKVNDIKSSILNRLGKGSPEEQIMDQLDEEDVKDAELAEAIQEEVEEPVVEDIPEDVEEPVVEDVEDTIQVVQEEHEEAESVDDVTFDEDETEVEQPEVDTSLALPDDDDDDSGNEEVPTPETLKPTRGMVVSDVRDLMDSYRAEISKEKANIEMLKKERDALYRDKVAVIEGRMQADIVAFTEKIIEKQTHLADLKERVLELPDKVDEVESLQRHMEELKTEGRSALERTRLKSEEYIESITSSKELIGERVDELQSAMDEQESKLGKLESISSTLDDRSEKLKTVLESAQAKAEQLNEAMASVRDELVNVEETRNEMVSMKDEIRDTVASHGQELQSLEDELEGISKVEHWIQEYVRDYEAKIGELEDYVSHSEDDLAELKESAESLYLNKYLGELESMTDAYGSQLEDALTREKDIGEEIAQSKERISDLARESQEMIKKIRGDVTESRDFEKVFARVKKKTKKVKAVVEEKQSERKRLKEESSTTRKSKSSGKPRAKPKAKKKAKAKAKAKPKDPRKRKPTKKKRK